MPPLPLARLHRLVIALARCPSVVAFARALVRAGREDDRLGRIAAVFTFVTRFVDAPRGPWEDRLLRMAGAFDGPAVVLAALLKALGEHAELVSLRGAIVVWVEVELADLAHLPPHALLVPWRGRLAIPLDPRRMGTPLGFLPPPLRAPLMPTERLRAS